MRDKTRIKRILKELEKIWESKSDLRLTQLLVNTGIVPNTPGSWYYLEDSEVENILKGFTVDENYDE